ncbi:MAG: S-methyl-5-thioribose-1-phosphate isomerase [Phycisphaerae bacterium]|nr:S-methyl-5-thioribose-1-phosphate isomerase [Phycisphaerae bacterium]MCZ2400620.1 S-methyl-5-thioribose-1-phosphate isomerase [Phycisphaerae bacterium]
MTTGFEEATPSLLRPRGVPETIAWRGGADGRLTILDQTLLPHAVRHVVCDTAEQVWEAIRSLRVRGAPLIGVAAAYGLCLGVRPRRDAARGALLADVRRVAEYLSSARPTAVNLLWALRRVQARAEQEPGAGCEVWRAMLAEAHAILHEDALACRRIGEHGAGLVPEGGGVLTHCNAGALATAGYGTALALLYVAHERGRRFRVFADETRPLLQGARLTAFELSAAGIDTTVLCDGAAAALLASGRVQMVVVGADRIAANGDTANKIGTYAVALAARAHGVPFYVAAPRSTFDPQAPTGAEIPIEQRDAREVREVAGGVVAAPGAGCFNPAFDVTPAGLVDGIVTEAGVLKPVTAANIAKFLAEQDLQRSA